MADRFPGIGSGPPFIRIDWKENAVGIQGPAIQKRLGLVRFLNACNENNVIDQLKEGVMICTGGDTLCGV